MILKTQIMVSRFPAACLALGFAVLLMIIACVTHVTVTQRSDDLFFEGFENPPATARPFVRWWWNGNCVSEEEVLRELDVLEAAGVGGVEINPIAMPPGSAETSDPALTWLSPEWNRVLKIAIDGARERGMTADLIVGTGWPFGGRFLKHEDQIKNVHVSQKPLSGPGSFDARVSELLEPPPGIHGLIKDAALKLQFLRLHPARMERFEEGIDLENRIRPDGTVVFEIPAGDHILYIGTRATGFREVMHGAPGADGPVLDHYRKEAVEHYLERMSSTLSPVLGDVMGDGLRAMFCDSIELSGANWTDDLPQEFARRRGYPITPYLPFVLTKDTSEADSLFADTVRRARYDYARTLVELFHERFIQPFHAWCKRNKTLSRYQAYGSPWLMGMLSGYTIPDIPEGDTWLFYTNRGVGPDLDQIRYAVWNKYASSGAHIAGRPVVSCESMTNTTGVFKATLSFIKQADDLNFITGINHTVLHGFNYSPPEAGFPGWVRYGTYFSEQNPWWPYFRCWADYNARLSWVLQNSTPVRRVAILGPTADVWSRALLWRLEFIDTPWYLHHLWQAVHKNGLSADYIDEAVLSESSFDEGRLRCGEADYDLLLLADVKSIEPATALALERYALAGGKIAFIGIAPSRSPGLMESRSNGDSVCASIERAINHDPSCVAIVAAPEEGNVLAWMTDLLSKFDMELDVKITDPDERLFQIRQEIGDRDLFFFANLDQESTVDFKAHFSIYDKTPWQWDPETGRRWVIPWAETPGVLDLHLAPLESMLLVFDPALSSIPQPGQVPDFTDPLIIDTPWKLTMTPVEGETFEHDLQALTDLSEDPELRAFSGTVVYETEFEVENIERSILHLGHVEGVVEAWLNGQPLGTRWYGRPVFDVGAALEKGRNVLKIELTTVLYNYCRILKDNPTAMRWAPQKRANRETDPTPIGLIGPVQLINRDH